jgi:hypothetical protein
MTNRTGLALLGGAGVGAGLMYLADPGAGKRRRALLRDQVVSANTKIGRFLRGRTEDVKNRIYGLYCEARGLAGQQCETGRRAIIDSNQRIRRVS